MKYTENFYISKNGVTLQDITSKIQSLCAGRANALVVFSVMGQKKKTKYNKNLQLCHVIVYAVCVAIFVITQYNTI